MKRLVFIMLFIFAAVLLVFMAGVANKLLSPSPPDPNDAAIEIPVQFGP